MFLLTTLSLRRERSRLLVAPLMALLKGFNVLEWPVFFPALDLNGESTVAKVDLFAKSLRCLHDWMVGSLGMPDLSGEMESDWGTLCAWASCGITSVEECWFLWWAKVLLCPTLFCWGFCERALIIVLCEWWISLNWGFMLVKLFWINWSAEQIQIKWFGIWYLTETFKLKFV